MTSNMSKNFKTKSKLRCMADGGSVADYMSGKSREQQLKEASGEWTPGQGQFANVRAKVTTSYEEKKKSALQRLFGMKDGGTPPNRRGKGTVDSYPATEYDFHGGSVEGPGGPTDDKVGPVKLSNKEYVLPADTVEAVGVDKLEALRAATHDFSKSDDADGLAGGGVVDWIKNTAGEVASKLRGAAAPTAAPTAAPANGAFRINPGAGIDSRVGQAARSLVPTAGDIPANRAMVPYEASAPASRLGGLARGIGRLGGAAGAASLLHSAATTYTPDAGATAPTGDRMQDAMSRFNQGRDEANAANAGAVRGLLSMGDAVTGAGTAGNFDNTAQSLGLRLQPSMQQGTAGGLANNKPSGIFPPGYGGGPDEGLLDTRSMRERGIASIRGGLPNMSGIPDSSPVITGGDPDSQYNQRGADEVIGSFNGRPITKGEADARAGRLQTASGYNMGPAKDPMQEALISALRGGGGGGGFSGPSSNASAINERFDALAKSLEGKYSAKGQGNLAKHLVEIEQLRAGALNNDAQVQSGLRGQNINASTAADNNRLQAAQVAAGMLRDRNSALAAGSKATADAQAKAQEMQDKALGQQDAAWKSLSEEIRTQYKDDPQAGESILSRIQSAGSDQIGEIANLHGADRMAAISDLVKSGQIAQSADDTRGWFSGQKDSGLPRVAGAPRAPEFFNDVFNGGSSVLPAVGREFQDLIYGGGQVVPLDNGQVVSNAVVGDNDAYRKRIAKRAAEDAPRRSSLRGE